MTWNFMTKIAIEKTVNLGAIFYCEFFTAYNGPSWTFKVAQIGQKLTLTKLSAPNGSISMAAESPNANQSPNWQLECACDVVIGSGD